MTVLILEKASVTAFQNEIVDEALKRLV